MLLIALIPAIIVATLLYMAVESTQEPALTQAQQDRNDEDLGLAIIGGIVLVYVPVSFLYNWIGTAAGRTWGKKILGMRIIKLEDGDRPGLGAAALRVLATMLLGIISIVQLADYVWMIWDDNKQTLHDKVAGTVVINDA